MILSVFYAELLLVALEMDVDFTTWRSIPTVEELSISAIGVAK